MSYDDLVDHTLRLWAAASICDSPILGQEAAGVVKAFQDVMSGARDDRPGLAELMAYVREGDIVVV
ncbi:hypothetical protein MAUB_47950 [Mycolicibacterium aubagnense]|uniref:Resolvase/invertase-type recombinase catalytic domain-containing protein n=1 Tax=Mycolicibacterium aubagnense TaxID=319707 RepID=A0ABN5YYH9_9MYCO|nr:hypothetical protein MAUB_47950 [Mycolicibacterium aubagnense]